MKDAEPKASADRVLEAWVQEKVSLEAVESEDALVELLRSARNGLPPPLSPAEAADLLRGVRAGMSSRSEHRVRPWWKWAAATAVLATALAVASRTLWERADATTAPVSREAEVVRDVRFKSVTNGKVVRFVTTAYRMVEKGRR